jgi:hypothetical protein
MKILLYIISLIFGCPTVPAIAAETSYLPLQVGNTWNLAMPWSKDPMIFKVMDEKNGTSHVHWQNPWLKTAEFYFRPADQKVFLVALDMGEGLGELPADTVYFDFTVAEGKRWSNSVGSYQVITRKKSVETPSGTFSDCVHIRLQHSDGTTFDWVFAPEIGFVQFGEGGGAYSLSSFTSAQKTIAAQSQPMQAPPTQSAGASKGTRILAMDVSVPEDQNYAKSFAIAKSIGIQAVTLSFDWKDIEKSPGKFQDPSGNLATANTYYPSTKTKVAFDIRPIHTNRLAVPADLENLAFDNPKMIKRFNAMIDYVLAQMSNVDLAVLFIGSEIDLYIEKNETLWRQYIRFFEATKQHIKRNHPTLNVGVELTYNGLTNEAVREFTQQLNALGDVVGVSYYHVNPDNFIAKDPKAIGTVFRTVTSLYPGRTIYFHQFGYPSSPMLQSSEAKQREFVQEAFRAWDAYAEEIKFISFTWLTDSSNDALTFFKQYYGSSDTNFVEFLRTLGFRKHAGSGTDKEALTALQTEAKARGW